METNSQKLLERAKCILEAAILKNTAARHQLGEITFHTNGYAEPEYPIPEKGIIAAGDWNNIRHEKETVCTLPSRIASLFDRYEIDLVWGDEWEECSKCNKLVRTKPNCYSWTRFYWSNEDEDDESVIICGECTQEDPRAYLEYLRGNERVANTFLDISKYGYKRLDQRFIRGLHPGQNDDPRMIAHALRKRDIDDFIFNIIYNSQFEIGFSVYIPLNAPTFELSDKETTGYEPVVVKQ